METEMNDLFNDRPGGSDEGEAETSFIEDGDDENFDDLLVRQDQNFDDINPSRFYEENWGIKPGKRKKSVNELYLTGRYTDLRVEFVRRVLGSEYRLDPNDGQNSRGFISRLSTDERKPTFDGTAVGYIIMDVSFRV
jgi:hypothetical protein